MLEAEIELLRAEIVELTKERDALQSQLDLARRKLAVLSNADALENLYQVGLKQEFDITALTKERDALKDAARLALDVCIEMRRYGNQRSVAMAIGAEEALKAAL